MKSVQLTQSQIKAYENGATMFLFPIDKNKMNFAMWERIKDDHYSHADELFLKDELGLQIGDKDIWVKEELVWCKQCKEMIFDFDYFSYPECPKCGEDYITEKGFQSSSQMTKKQSRYTLKEILDVKIVKVQDIELAKYLDKIKFPLEAVGGLSYSFERFYNQQLKEQNINSTYQDNDYIFLVEFKR